MPCKLHIKNLSNAVENAFTDHVILFDENHFLFQQNNKVNKRKLIKATIQGTARVINYEDLIKAEREHDRKEATSGRNYGP